MLTPEERRLIRIKNLGIGMLGKKRSEETKEKIRKKMKGRKPSLANRKAVSKSNKQRIVSKKTREKMSNAHKKEKHPLWKGGVCIYKNRVFILKPEHPNSQKNGYVRRSRLIAEKALGRYLKKNEIVHHVDDNPLNDKNNNLVICDSSYHSWIHAKMKNFKIGINQLQEMPE